MQAKIPAPTDRAEASHTAGRISKGLSHPAAARTAATVVGSSWMDAVLHTTSRHSSSLAAPGLLRLMPLAASIPKGVAALPNPNRLADTLADRLSITAPSRAAPGNSRPSTGRSSRDNPPARPDWRMTSITPVHRQSIPAMDRQSSTASFAPVTAAAATASPRPPAIPNSMDAAVIPVHRIDITTPSAPFFP